MRTIAGRISLTLAGALMSSAIALPAMAESPVTDERLANADSEPQNWLTSGQNYEGQRYSRLDEINTGNIADLRVAFTIPLSSVFTGRSGSVIDTNPLIDEGIMYFEDGQGVFYKLDLSAGNTSSLVWMVDATMAKDVAGQTRGFALLDNMVVKCMRDGRVVAVDRATGDFLWDVKRVGIEHPKGAGFNIAAEACTGGTMAMGGHVIVANGNGDGGTRGWVEALDAETGEEIWRWYAIPGPGEAGHETWTDDHNAWKTGGAGMWTAGTYDPATRLTYWGTANPVPMFDPEFRPGDNLYTNSLVVLNIDTGELQWYFQYTPNEGWDYDENGVHMLLDGNRVAHFARNGYFYQFDRSTGAFLNAAQYVDEVNWTAGLDPKTGLPVEYNPDLEIQEYIPEYRFMRGESVDQNRMVCPNLTGGVRWQYPAYNPDTGIAYAVGSDGCFNVEVVAAVPLGPEGGFNEEEAGIHGFHGDWAAEVINDRGAFLLGAMWALDTNSNQKLATHQRPFVYESGATVTAGGLVLTSTIDGWVFAHDARTLDVLWQFDMGTASRGTPISFAIDGKQYIAVIASAEPPTTKFQGAETRNMAKGAAVYVFTL